MRTYEDEFFAVGHRINDLLSFLDTGFPGFIDVATRSGSVAI